MNKLITQIRQHIKIERLKYITLFLLFLIIPALFIGCIHFSKAISKVNVFEYTSFEVEQKTNSSTLDLVKDTQLFKQTDATVSKDFMLIRNLVSQFEDFSYEQKITTNDTLPLDPTSLPNENSIILSVNARNDASEGKNYTFILDITNEQLYIDDATMISQFKSEEFIKLMDSNLLKMNIDVEEIPTLQVSVEATPILTAQSIQWEHHFYGERYVQSKLDAPDINTLTPTMLTKQSSLYLTWTHTEPSTSQIIITKQPTPQDNSSTEENLLPVTTDLDLLTSSPITYQLPTESGYYLVEVLSTWSPSDTEDYGSSSTRFYLEINYPETLTIRNTTIEPGDLIVIEAVHLSNKENYSIETNLTTSKLSFTSSGTNNYLFIPLMSKYVPGDYYLTIKNIQTGTIVSDFAITVAEKIFEIQQLTTSTATASLQNQANNDQLAEALNRARQNPSQEKLWTGNFIQPCEGRISTEYGVIRYTNGSETGTRHSGIDFANPIGTPAFATQNGYVRLAEFLNITGNTLVIDHGLGIYSQYYHLDSFDVKVGDYVEVGSIVGKIGTTGFSTGSHLHFCMYYNGIYLNPWKFFGNAPF